MCDSGAQLGGRAAMENLPQVLADPADRLPDLLLGGGEDAAT